MSEKEKKEVDLSLRQFIKELGYIAGGSAILSSMPWLQSFTMKKAREINNEKACIGSVSYTHLPIIGILLLPSLR